jgi:energy-coupling factor transport system substrate-specific component
MFSGCQFSLYPVTDRFVQIILGALEVLKGRTDARIETDDISTLIVGPSEQVFAAVQAVFLKACAETDHVVINATFSRGCPGEPDDPICQPDSATKSDAAKAVAIEDLTKLESSGVPVKAQFALYPLGVPDYMDTIYAEIEATKTEGVFKRGKHFVTRIGGDANQVFAALQAAFDRAAEHAEHVVLTTTLLHDVPIII